MEVCDDDDDCWDDGSGDGGSMEDQCLQWYWTIYYVTQDYHAAQLELTTAWAAWVMDGEQFAQDAASGDEKHAAGDALQVAIDEGNIASAQMDVNSDQFELDLVSENYSSACM